MNRQVRMWSVRGLVTAAVCFGSATAGCIPFSGREFREAAGPAFESGVTLIVNGVLEGLFAVVEPDPE